MFEIEEPFDVTAVEARLAVAVERVEELGLELPEEPEPEPEPELEPEPEPVLLPPAAPADGDILLGATFASSAKVETLRDLFPAGLTEPNQFQALAEGTAELIRIDHPNHALLAMFSLRAVIPDGLCVVDLDSICWQFCGICLDGHEAGK